MIEGKSQKLKVRGHATFDTGLHTFAFYLLTFVFCLKKMHILELILAVLPGLLLCYLVFRLDKYDEEPVGWLIGSFGLGMLLTIPAMWLELRGFRFFEIAEPRSVWLTASLAFVVIALNEELLKMIGLLAVPFRSPVFNEPLDGIVYSMMIGMGFATAENLIYAERFGIETIFIRAFTAVPAHAVFAIYSGYFVGLAKFDPARKWQLLRRGFIYTVTLHGLYDFLIIQKYEEWLTVLATFGLYGSLIYSAKLIQLHTDNSPFRTKTIGESAV